MERNSTPDAWIMRSDEDGVTTWGALRYSATQVANSLVNGAVRSAGALAAQRGETLPAGWSAWQSPNGVTHAIPPTGPCATCGNGRHEFPC
jgi:hypothetical protein